MITVNNDLIAKVSSTPIDVNFTPVLVLAAIFCGLAVVYLVVQFNR